MEIDVPYIDVQWKECNPTAVVGMTLLWKAYIIAVMLLALPSGIGPGAYAFTIIWNANQPQLKEPLDTSGGTLGFHGSLVANG